MTRFPVWLFSLAVVLTVSLQTTAAQPSLDATLYVAMANEFLEINVRERAITGRWPLPAGGETYATPDGQFLVGRRLQPLPAGLIAWHRLSRTLLPALAIIASPSWPHVLGQPSRLEAYEIDQARNVIAVTPSGVRRLTVPPPCIPSAIRALSADGRRLAIGCAFSLEANIVIYDFDQQRVVRQLAQGSGFPVAFSADGSALFIIEGNAVLRKVSVETGDVLAERRLLHGGWVYVDTYSSRVVVAGDQRVTMPEDGTVVLDADTLDLITTAVPELGTIWAFDPDRPLAYTVRSTFAPSGGYRSRLLAVDTNSMTAFDVAELPPLLAQFITLVPRPSPPTNVTAAVSGRTVRLSWTPGARGIPSRYVVSVGSAPGLADLTVFDVGPRTSVLVAPVPAGRYFVRVQAGNADGLGAASSSATVIVP